VTLAAMAEVGGRYVGVNLSSLTCAGISGPDASRDDPCWFMTELARETRSLDASGRVLVHDWAADLGTMSERIVGSLRSLLAAPVSLGLSLRDDPSDGEGVDARRFVHRTGPSCRGEAPRTSCVEPAPGLTAEQSVATLDDTTFYGVVPGTEVTFQLTLWNDFLPEDGRTRFFRLDVELVDDEGRVLDARPIVVVIPARRESLM
jgi:hypothetical protein